MSHILTNYNDTGILICTNSNGSEKGISEAGLALNSNFKAIASRVPYTGATEGVDLGTHGLITEHVRIDSGSEALVVGNGAATGGVMVQGSSPNWAADSPGFLLDFDGANCRLVHFASTGGFQFVDFASLTVVGYIGNDGSASFAGGAAQIDNIGNLTTASLTGSGGALTIGSNTGTAAWINSDGSASLASGALAVDANGGLKLAEYSTIASPVEGQIAWNYTTHALTTYNGSAWT